MSDDWRKWRSHFTKEQLQDRISFCVRCFANDDFSSWGGDIIGDYCTNCGGGGCGIQLPRVDIYSILESASWVGQRYYPSEEDLERRKNEDIAGDLVNRLRLARSIGGEGLSKAISDLMDFLESKRLVNNVGITSTYSIITGEVDYFDGRINVGVIRDVTDQLKERYTGKRVRIVIEELD